MRLGANKLKDLYPARKWNKSSVSALRTAVAYLCPILDAALTAWESEQSEANALQLMHTVMLRASLASEVILPSTNLRGAKSNIINSTVLHLPGDMTRQLHVNKNTIKSLKLIAS